VRAREITIVVSLALHGVIFGAALNVAHERKARRATTVSVADEKKKQPEKKKPEPPKPPPVAPKPKPLAKAAPAPAPVSAPAPVAAAPSAPVATDIQLGNDTGMDMGTGALDHAETRPAQPTEQHPKPSAATVKTPIHVDTPPPSQIDSGACTEPPGKPEPTMKTEIEYTEEARAAGIQGRLVLKVTVDAEGNVTDVTVVAGVDGALDAAAIAIVKTWRFKPAMACGKPVAGGTYTIARRFELGD
jgi:TonB family protein